jgi:NADH dehydrogenase
MNMHSQEKNIVIVGGGFAGVACALELAKHAPKNCHITLISDKPHFEYHAALYRVVTGRSPLEVCILLDEIFKHTSVSVIQDTISAINEHDRVVQGTQNVTYPYDYLVLTLGSETTYYDTPGLEELSFGFKSIEEALKLKRHLHASFAACVTANKDEALCNTHLVVVGGGPSGTELAAELALYADKLARKHTIDPTLVTVELIQSPAHLVPMLPVEVTERIEARIRSLGVNVYVNRRLIKEEVAEVFLKDMRMNAKTVIWTAGVKPHQLYVKLTQAKTNEKGQIEVNKHLQIADQSPVYVGGDAAATKHSGMAQTALYDGTYIAKDIIARIENYPRPTYSPKQPIYSIPVGSNWAATVWGDKKFYGRVGWWLRRLLDLNVFLAILPWRKALLAFQSGSVVSEACPVCNPITQQSGIQK